MFLGRSLRVCAGLLIESHRDPWIGMPEKLLYDLHMFTLLRQERCQRATERVSANALGDTHFFGRRLNVVPQYHIQPERAFARFAR